MSKTRKWTSEEHAVLVTSWSADRSQKWAILRSDQDLDQDNSDRVYVSLHRGRHDRSGKLLVVRRTDQIAVGEFYLWEIVSE